MMIRNISLGLLILLFVSADSMIARQSTRVEVEPNDSISDTGPHACDLQQGWGWDSQISGSISPQDTDIWCATEPLVPIGDFITFLGITCDQEMTWFDETSYRGFPGCPNLQNPISESPSQGGGTMSNSAEWKLSGVRYFCFSIQSTSHTGAYSCEVNATILPVELSSFSAFVRKEQILLNWHTLSETNNSGFEIQTSRQGSWMTLVFVEGNGTTTERQEYNYSLIDFDYGLHKFRLKQLDIDGGFSLSDEVEIELLPENGFFISELYPNPFSTEGTIKIHSPVRQLIEVKFVNMLGQVLDVVHKGIVDAQETLSLEIRPQTSLPSGRYLLHIEGENFTETRSAFLVR